MKILHIGLRYGRAVGFDQIVESFSIALSVVHGLIRYLARLGGFSNANNRLNHAGLDALEETVQLFII